MAALPLILLPGLLCDRRVWDGIKSGLGGDIDASIADLTRDDTIMGMAKRVLSQAPSRFALAGFSMGAIVALHVARLAPERLSHLIILNSTARPDLESRRAIRDVQIAASKAGRLEQLLIEEMLPFYFAPAFADDARLRGIVRAMARELGVDVFDRQMRALRDRDDSRPHLPAIATPTLILAAAQDTMCPMDRHVEMQDAIAGSRLQVLENAGHMAPLECPAAISVAMRRFLVDA